MNGGAEPQSLPGAGMPPAAINRAEGIARLMGDAGLFARVLARFRKDYRHAADRIREALAVGDAELALRQAHTLKGAAGMIEATPLREAAQALEQALRRSDCHLAPRLARLEHALDRLLLELDAEQDVVPMAQAARRSADGGTVAARLRALLEDGNGDAVELVQEAAASLTMEIGEERYRRIAAAIMDFDFEGALATLNA